MAMYTSLVTNAAWPHQQYLVYYCTKDITIIVSVSLKVSKLGGGNCQACCPGEEPCEAVLAPFGQDQ